MSLGDLYGAVDSQDKFHLYLSVLLKCCCIVKHKMNPIFQQFYTFSTITYPMALIKKGFSLQIISLESTSYLLGKESAFIAKMLFQPNSQTVANRLLWFCQFAKKVAEK